MSSTGIELMELVEEVEAEIAACREESSGDGKGDGLGVGDVPVPFSGPGDGGPDRTPADAEANRGDRHPPDRGGSQSPFSQSPSRCSAARLAANRANARKSTGPRTPEGKARVARNAIRHGILCREAVLEIEGREEFEEFRLALGRDLAPRGPREEMLAERIIAQSWRLRRVLRMDAALFERDVMHAVGVEESAGVRRGAPREEPPHAATLGSALAVSLGATHSPYETLRRYERAIERDLDGCTRQLDELQKARSWAGAGEEEEREEGEDVREAAREEAAQEAAAGESESAQGEGDTSGNGFVSQDAPRVSRGRDAGAPAEDGFVSQKGGGPPIPVRATAALSSSCEIARAEDAAANGAAVTPGRRECNPATPGLHAEERGLRVQAEDACTPYSAAAV